VTSNCPGGESLLEGIPARLYPDRGTGAPFRPVPDRAGPGAENNPAFEFPSAQATS
jgi:hypothetical protein